MLSELLAGALVSFINFGIHGVMTGLIVVATRHTATLTDHLGMFGRLSALLTVTMVVLMCAHVAEIGVWATYYHLAGMKSAAPTCSISRSRTTPRSGTAMPSPPKAAAWRCRSPRLTGCS